MHKIIRGKKSVRQLFNESGFTSTIVVVFERFGNPTGFMIYRNAQPVGSLLFSGFRVARGLRKLVDKAGVAKVVGPSRNPRSEMAVKLKDFLTSLPQAQGRFSTNLEVYEKDGREVLSLNLKGVPCVDFYFRLN
jgi:rRNA maturation protein Rpf1